MRAWQRLHCPSYADYLPFLEEEVQARQVLNAETGLVLAAGAGCEWLVHLDSDELFYTGDPLDGTQVSLDRPFGDLAKDGAYQMTYLNHEGVPEVGTSPSLTLTTPTPTPYSHAPLPSPSHSPRPLALIRRPCV